MSPHLALQLCKAFIRSKLEFGCTVWGFRIHNAKHLKLLESAQRGAASLILKAMKSTPTDGLESELSILPIDLRLEELQQHEAVKLLIKEDDYIQSNMKGRNKAQTMGGPFENLRSLTKQILQFLSQTKKCNVHQLRLPKETPATLKLFHIPNLWLALPETKLQFSVPLDNTNNMQHYIRSILDTGTKKTIIVFTIGSAQSISGPTRSGVIIKKQGRNITPIKIGKAVNYMGSSYERELEAIKIATKYTRNNISPSNDSLHIFSDWQSAISAVTSQNRENYHNSTIRAIRENLMDTSPKVQNRLVYCPVHQGIQENELADSLAKTASKKAKHLQPNTQLSSSEIQQGNKMLSISKWTRRWENPKHTKYKDIVRSISHKKLTLRATLKMKKI